MGERETLVFKLWKFENTGQEPMGMTVASLLPWVPGVLFACESLAIEGQSLQNPTWYRHIFQRNWNLQETGKA